MSAVPDVGLAFWSTLCQSPLLPVQCHGPVLAVSQQQDSLSNRATVTKTSPTQECKHGPGLAVLLQEGTPDGLAGTGIVSAEENRARKSLLFLRSPVLAEKGRCATHDGLSGTLISERMAGWVCLNYEVLNLWCIIMLRLMCICPRSHHPTLSMPEHPGLLYDENGACSNMARGNGFTLRVSRLRFRH